MLPAGPRGKTLPVPARSGCAGCAGLAVALRWPGGVIGTLHLGWVVVETERRRRLNRQSGVLLAPSRRAAERAAYLRFLRARDAFERGERLGRKPLELEARTDRDLLAGARNRRGLRGRFTAMLRADPEHSLGGVEGWTAPRGRLPRIVLLQRGPSVEALTAAAVNAVSAWARPGLADHVRRCWPSAAAEVLTAAEHYDRLRNVRGIAYEMLALITAGLEEPDDDRPVLAVALHEIHRHAEVKR